MFQQKRNKQFKYKSRLSKDGEYTVENDSKEDTLSKMELLKRPVRKSKAVKLPFLLILLAIIIAVMYYLEKKMS